MVSLEEIYTFLLNLPGGRMTMAVVVFIAAAFLLYYAAITVIAVFKKLSSKTKTTLDDVLADRARRPLKFISIVVAAFLASQAAYPDADIMGHSTFEIFKVLLMFCAIIFIDSLLDGILFWYGKEIAPKTSSKFDDEMFPLFRKIARVLVYVVGLIIILSELGVEIAPLIAGLGIAGLAVALALQDTLGNFFSGVYMMADKPIRPNDFVRIGDRVEGTVIEVGWRSTKILTLENNYVFLPNSEVAKSTITNFYSPEEKMGYVMEFSASYDDEPEKVIDALLEAAKVVGGKSGKIVSADGSPWARADSFGESSVNYKVGVQVPSYRDRFTVKGEMIKEVYKQFKAKGISIPYPTRTVFLKDEAGGKKEIRIKKGGKGA